MIGRNNGCKYMYRKQRKMERKQWPLKGSFSMSEWMGEKMKHQQGLIQRGE
jgi:hypothetical protein